MKAEWANQRSGRYDGTTCVVLEHIALPSSDVWTIRGLRIASLRRQKPLSYTEPDLIEATFRPDTAILIWNPIYSGEQGALTKEFDLFACRLIPVLLVFLSVCGIAAAAEPMTWPRGDGPEQNRVSRERRIDLSWGDAKAYTDETVDLAPVPSEKSDRPELWKIEGLPGDQTPLVFNDKLYLLRQDRQPSDNSATNDAAPVPAISRYAIDCWLVTGRDQQARFRYRLPEADQPDLSPPELTGDPLWRQLFCLTGSGELIALDSDLGSELWTIDLPELIGRNTAPTQIAPPLLFEHLAIMSLQWTGTDDQPAGSYLIGIDRRNGQPHWLQHQTGNAAATFPAPAPVLCVAGKQVAVACQLTPGFVQLMQVRTGKPIEKLSLGNASSRAVELLFESGRLAILESTEAAPNPPEWTLSCFKLPGVEAPTETSRLLSRNELGAHDQVTALLKSESMFAATSSGLLRRISLADAAEKQSPTEQDFPLSSVGLHDMIWLDNQLVITGESGHWQVFVFAKPSEETSLPPLEQYYVELWDHPLAGPPVVAKQRVYVRHHGLLVALGELDDQKAVSDLLISYPARAGEDKNNSPVTTQILLVPAVQDLHPGFETRFQVHGFSESGEFTELVAPKDVEWLWEGPGELDAETGLLTAPAELESELAQPLRVRWNQAEAAATVRLLPDPSPELNLQTEIE